MRNVKNFKFILLLLIILSLALCACGRKNDMSTVQSLSELHDKSFTVGTPTADDAHGELTALFPKAELLAYDDILTGLHALESGKLDAFASGRFFIERDIAETGITDIRILDEPVKTYYVGLGLCEDTPVENYTDRVNAALRELDENGTLADMQKRWFLDGSEEMPEIRTPEQPEYTLRVVTYGAARPYSYIRDNTLTGFDVELACRVAAALNCGISFEMADYSSMLMGLSTGKYDMISANLYISQNRAENVCFSDPYSQNDICLCVYSPGGTRGTAVRSLADLSGRKLNIGMPSDYDLTEELNSFCGDYTLYPYDSLLLGIQAIRTGKIDVYICGKEYLDEAEKKNNLKGLKILDTPVKIYECGLGLSDLAPIEDYEAKINTIIDELKADGTLDEMRERWCGSASADMPEIPVHTDADYTLRVATFGQMKPFTFIQNNQLAGFDVELAYRIADKMGCNIQLDTAEFGSMLLGLSEGKYDMIASQLYITDERQEHIIFSKPYSSCTISALVNDPDGTVGVRDTLSSIRSGLNSTFAEESRWKMVLSGLGTTCVITFFGFLLANVFGAVFCAFAMSGHRFWRGVYEVYFRLMQGTPIVVLLMILFYIIFGRSSLSGTFVAILGFGLSNGASLAQQFQGAISSVSQGQSEASLALGFSGWQTFIGIVLPQALRRLLPGYFSELIGLMKATSVVGYVAVTDLTKVSDIIRSATYDAFFPLISVALIYFIIAMLLLTVVKAILRKLEPKRVTAQEVNK